MCCGFGVEARASAKKSVRHGGRGFFVACNRCAARIPLQSPVTFPNHRALRLNVSIEIRDGAGTGVNQRFMALEVASTRLDRVLHLPPAHHKFLFPIQKVSNGHVCALTSELASPVAAATVNSVEIAGLSIL
jgi:hypothetical protein